MATITEEQHKVITSNADTIIVNACAGSGKTTTLENFARAHADKSILYLVFNKSAEKEARNRFPSNVTPKTSHGLAYQRFGYPYAGKLGTPRAFHARNFLRPAMNSDEGLVFANLALETVNRFLVSSDMALLPAHVNIVQARSCGFNQEDIHEAAVRLWEAMQDTSIAAMPMPHDGYLKLYQLSRPNLSRYDYVLLDEAQDTNPCVSGFILPQPTGIVMVGDKHQGIYAFRGAINAMERLSAERKGSESLALTGSFRFGQPIADVANAILGIFKGESMRIRGLGGPSVVSERFVGNLRTAFIHRTNAGLFDRAVDVVQAGLRVNFVGGINGYNFETIHDVWRIMNGEHQSIRDPFMRSFRSLDDLEIYAEATEDREIQVRVKVAKKYSFRIPRLLEKLREAQVPDGEQGAISGCVSLTTAHKSKGLQWPQVVLGDDFPELMHESGVPLAAGLLPPGVKSEPLYDEEANLYYVAVTRGEERLVLNKTLTDLMNWVRYYGLP